MASHSDRTRAASPSGRTVRGAGIPQRLLVACARLGPRLSAAAAAGALAEGIQQGGLPEPDVCLLPIPREHGEDLRGLLDELDFDARLRSARAVVVAAPRLEQRTLAASMTFEIATRARQGGVPAYGVAGESSLDAFDARILDLQVILQARSRKALVDAGRELAGLV